VLHVADLDDLQEEVAIKQNPVPSGKSSNSKYSEKLTKFLNSE